MAVSYHRHDLFAVKNFCSLAYHHKKNQPRLLP